MQEFASVCGLICAVLSLVTICVVTLRVVLGPPVYCDEIKIRKLLASEIAVKASNMFPGGTQLSKLCSLAAHSIALAVEVHPEGRVDADYVRRALLEGLTEYEKGLKEPEAKQCETS